MRLKLNFSSEKQIFLPFGYFAAIQGLIYNLFNRPSGHWLHSEGFKFNNKHFKMFVFSEINEKAKVLKGKGFLFPKTISFSIASPIKGMLEEIASNLISRQAVKLGINSIELESITPQKFSISEKIYVKTISPIEVHTTHKNSPIKTDFYSPYHNVFFDLIKENLKIKFEILNGKPCPYHFEIKPVPRINYKQRVIKVKNTIVKGWKGNFQLEGDKEMIMLALDCGLGSKNSLGFGMVEPV